MAQDGDAAAKDAAAPTVEFTDADKTPEAIKKGLVQLEKSAKAYRAAPAITEDILINVATPMGPQNSKLSSVWGPNGTFEVTAERGEMVITSDGSSVYFVSKDAPDQYIAAEIDPKEPLAAFLKVTGGGGLPDPVAGFRLGTEKKAEDLPSLMSMGALQNVKASGFQVTDGVSHLLLSGGGGSNVITFDPKTSLITRSVMAFSPPGAPAGFEITVTFAFNPKVLEKLPKAIAFDAGDRTRVNSVEELGPQPVKVGEPAPTFTLATLEGEDVSLVALKGQIVVLDFWATWCGPCRKGLPELEKVAKWVAEEDLPIKIYAIDVWENGDKDARTKVASDFWSKKAFSFPTLMDFDDKVVGSYGIGGIPATFIIGRDGTIIGYHGGFDPDMAEKLKKELQEALQEKG